jgi:hypothetical protein
MTAAAWRDDLDALQFCLPEHGGLCLVHRLAFRTLVGSEPSRDACLGFFAAQEAAFLSAARLKIARQAIEPGRNLHLNSRDIRRAIVGETSDAEGNSCRVLRG